MGERGREGDLEEGSEVRSGRLFRFISIALAWVMFGCRDQRYRIAEGLIWRLEICHSVEQTLVFSFFKQGLFSF